jgi:DMSO/TMAO reductase YedYZ molybdopterin-dependent catalytic subunit
MNLSAAKFWFVTLLWLGYQSVPLFGQSLKEKDPTGENPLSWKHPEMIVHNERPWNMETPVHLLDESTTSIEKMFVRNNGLLPANLNASDWTLTIEGEGVVKAKTYTLAELKSKFKHYSYNLVLECGGNGRGEINPPATGNQWGYGAVSCGRWTGVRLKDVLADVGLKENAVYIGYYGTDRHLSGDASKVVISRGVPIDKALEDETLLAFSLNGEEIPAIHGYPLRLVIGGWPASVSGKWLHRLVVRDKVHDGPKMEAPSYQVPKYPVQPGAEVAPEDMVIIESMPVKSIITYPKTGALVKKGQRFEVRGHAWAGDLKVKTVEISTDYGQTWKPAQLSDPPNRLAWQDFKAPIQFPEPGYYEIWVKATDEKGVSQPMVVPGWNPRGYLNNATHRIAVKVE